MKTFRLFIEGVSDFCSTGCFVHCCNVFSSVGEFVRADAARRDVSSGSVSLPQTSALTV